ncbi:MAG: TauD/TfdA dioxygenase family protein [Myxococcota bacterium]
MALDIAKRTSAIGADVLGLDLTKALSEADFAALQSALDEHMVLFLGEHDISPAEQRAFAARFGAIERHPFARHLDDPEDVGLLDQTEPKRDGANNWHTDSTFMPTPPSALVLRAVQLPSLGGDTTWASMVAAYDALSEPLRRALEALTATHDVTGPLVRAIQTGHSVGGLDEIQAAWPPISHPVVCRHPHTGRKLLYVNSNFTTRIDGVTERESEMLLRFLFEWIRSPEFQVRFTWRPGSVVLWDNRSTQHFAVADYGERRIMHRIQVAGDWSPSA